MIKMLSILLGTVLTLHTARAQEIISGTNNYVEYHVGTMPIVISVAHGGDIEPMTIPDRSCNNPVYATDAYTIETALEIKNTLYNLSGCYPHIIINNLKRSKLDCNRNIADGACGNPEAETAWNEFHDFIVAAENTANQEYDDQSFFIDLHGHGNPIQRIELGYLLYDDELELPDSVLNGEEYIDYSSIQNLANANVNNYTHAQLLRGSEAFGTLLANQNYPSVPSQQIPYPGTNTNYFSGGYITANHTSYASDVNINGLQMELNYTDIRDTQENRIQFSSAFAQAITEYLNTHFTVSWGACFQLSNTITVQEFSDSISLFPNPVSDGNSIAVLNEINGDFNYAIFGSTGTQLKEGRIRKHENRIAIVDLSSGLYLVKIFNVNDGNVKTLKLIIE